MIVKSLAQWLYTKEKFAEAKTGEGKTNMIVCAAYLNALSKKGVHVVTVNDYLAKKEIVKTWVEFIIF